MGPQGTNPYGQQPGQPGQQPIPPGQHQVPRGGPVLIPPGF